MTDCNKLFDEFITEVMNWVGQTASNFPPSGSLATMMSADKLKATFLANCQIQSKDAIETSAQMLHDLHQRNK